MEKIAVDKLLKKKKCAFINHPVRVIYKCVLYKVLHGRE